MLRILQRLIPIFLQASRSKYFGFIQGHKYLPEYILGQMKLLVGVKDSDMVAIYEEGFASIIGAGKCVAYASGRMGFYALMSELGIGVGDEVILTGATCSVMANSVLRIGATPIFSDIDPTSFGSCPKCIKHCITYRTKLIVAQHTFGIPCNIKSIVDIAKRHGIFLVEDCALTLGSKVDNIVVGNFGDAALFSTDHSKPINTMIGGLIYSRSSDLIANLRKSQLSYQELSLSKQQALWGRFLLERLFCIPTQYRWMGFIDLILLVSHRLFNFSYAFLTDDSSFIPSSTYPYPAKLPAFLAFLGIYEIKRWSKEVIMRKHLLTQLLKVSSNSSISCLISQVYYDNRYDIVPLRFAWIDDDGKSRRRLLRHFIFTPGTWFMRPIISTSDPLHKFGYRDNSCPISENSGPNMVNLPCNVPETYMVILANLFEQSLK